MNIVIYLDKNFLRSSALQNLIWCTQITVIHPFGLFSNYGLFDINLNLLRTNVHQVFNRAIILRFTVTSIHSTLLSDVPMRYFQAIIYKQSLTRRNSGHLYTYHLFNEDVKKTYSKKTKIINKDVARNLFKED